MIACALLLLAVTPSSPVDTGMPDREVLAAAERSFAEGTALRHDEAAARPAFARAASSYDELWQRGHRDPELALNRANAHRLAGSLPRAIAVLNEGLAAARWNRPLQIGLEDARSAVGYPHGTDLAAQCRPVPPSSIGTRLSPFDASLVAGALWLLACAGLARFAMIRGAWWLVFAGVWMAALATFGIAWTVDREQQLRENELPLVVVADDVVLRKGNADTFPARLDGQQRLPRGVEARMLAERGGWMQIRLTGGAVGWIPDAAVLKPGR